MQRKLMKNNQDSRYFNAQLLVRYPRFKSVFFSILPIIQDLLCEPCRSNRSLYSNCGVTLKFFSFHAIASTKSFPGTLRKFSYRQFSPILWIMDDFSFFIEEQAICQNGLSSPELFLIRSSI